MDYNDVIEKNRKKYIDIVNEINENAIKLIG